MRGYDGALGRDPAGLDAAHVFWHSQGGPDETDNALVLCSLHHVPFDLGALGLNGNLSVRVQRVGFGRRQYVRLGRLRRRQRCQWHGHGQDFDIAGAIKFWKDTADGGRVVLQEPLLDYVAFYQRAPDITPSMFLQAVAGPLSADVLAAYDAPFPDRTFKAGLRQMIALIPLTRNDPGAAIGRTAMAALGQWRQPFLTAYSDGDPATRGWDTVFQQHIPGARGQDHSTITGAGHFVPEQRGDELARLVATFVAGTSSPG